MYGENQRQPFHVTAGWHLSFGVNTDIVIDLVPLLFKGRPNWNLEFGKLQQAHTGKKVGVFFCGPKVLSSQLHENCNKYTDETTQFYFNKENF